MPEEPMQELWVALAGPAVNVVIALFCLAGWASAWATRRWIGCGQRRIHRARHACQRLPGGLQSAPGVPDGRRSRAPRAVGHANGIHASHTACGASIGQGMAILFGFLGLQGNPMLIFIALFVWIGAGQEGSMVR